MGESHPSLTAVETPVLGIPQPSASFAAEIGLVLGVTGSPQPSSEDEDAGAAAGGLGIPHPSVSLTANEVAFPESPHP